jgi:hypothetical protein
VIVKVGSSSFDANESWPPWLLFAPGYICDCVNIRVTLLG